MGLYVETRPVPITTYNRLCHIVKQKSQACLSYIQSGVCVPVNFTITENFCAIFCLPQSTPAESTTKKSRLHWGRDFYLKRREINGGLCGPIYSVSRLCHGAGAGQRFLRRKPAAGKPDLNQAICRSRNKKTGCGRPPTGGFGKGGRSRDRRP